MRLLDLYCCAGGAAKGYADAGFEVVGVDINYQPRYPYKFIRGDAVTVAKRLLAKEHFDAIHASPPCQAHSDLQKQSKLHYTDWIPATRDLLVSSGLPFVIENVEGAPLEHPFMLCGNMFDELRVYRHRLFEVNFILPVPDHPEHEEVCFTYDKRKKHYGQPLDLTTMRVQVTGGGNAPVWAKAQAMGIDWMKGYELNEAIPPVYTRYIGKYLAMACRPRATTCPCIMAMQQDPECDWHGRGVSLHRLPA